MSNASFHRSKQAYALLVRLYPNNYKQEFAQEMLYVFSEQLKDAYAERRNQGIFLVWSRTIVDVIKSLITQHIEQQKERLSMKNQPSLQKSILRIAAVTTGVLLIPAIGMQVSSEWNWGVFDFVVMGALIAAIGTIIELVNHTVQNKHHRIALMIGLVLLGLYIWAELAVGIFTSLGS